MGRKRRKQPEILNDVIYIDGISLRFEKEVRGCRCTHFLYRSIKGGYLVSFTNIDVELGELGEKRRGKLWMK